MQHKEEQFKLAFVVESKMAPSSVHASFRMTLQMPSPPSASSLGTIFFLSELDDLDTNDMAQSSKRIYSESEKWMHFNDALMR